MSSLFQYKIKTFWKQQTANQTANSKQWQHVFSHFLITHGQKIFFFFAYMKIASGTRKEAGRLTENRDGKCDVRLLAFPSLSRSQMPHIEQSVYTIWRQNLHNKTSLLSVINCMRSPLVYSMLTPAKMQKEINLA